jgi:hypothetical protein
VLRCRFPKPSSHLSSIAKLCKSGPLAAAATEAGQFTEAQQFTGGLQFTGEPQCIAAEQWFDEGRLYAAVGTMEAATAILTIKIAEAAVIMGAEFIVAVPSSEAEPS